MPTNPRSVFAATAFLAAALVPSAPAAAEAATAWEDQRLERRDYERIVAVHSAPDPLTAQPTANAPLSDYDVITEPRWGVFEGGGAQLDAYDFARRVGDDSTLAMLDGLVRRSRRRGGLAAGLGVVLMGAGAGIVVAQAGDEEAATALSVGASLGFLAGLVTTSAGAHTAMGARRQHAAIDESWSATRVDELIEAHNRALKRDLGLDQR